MDKARADLAVYRLETARQCIISAKALIEISDYKGAANRSYYAVFHCMRSVLALSSIDFSKHSAVGAYFRKEYILVSKKFVSFKKPMNPSKFQTHPAVLELFALCAIPAVSLKGRKNTSANNA